MSDTLVRVYLPLVGLERWGVRGSERKFVSNAVDEDGDGLCAGDRNLLLTSRFQKQKECSPHPSDQKL